MKKAAHKKKISHFPKKHPISFVRYVVITLGVLALIFGVKSVLGASQTVHVLGVKTGPVPVLLADQGSDAGSTSDGNGGNSESSSDKSGSSGGSSSGGSGSSDNNSGSNSSGGVTTGSSLVSQDTQVDCVGPDGKHFTTSFHDCQEINQKWNNAGFRFTPLAKPQESLKPETEQPEKEASGPAHSQLEMQIEGNKGEVNMETPGLHIEIKREDDGTVHLTAKKEDGTEINLQTSALGQLNDALKDKEVEVATSAGALSNLVLRRKGVEAETELPIGVDPNTHELTVTTPTGIKTVTVLPDQAVNNLLTGKVLTSVETQVSSASGSINKVSTLTELNNQPVFAVNGISQKNLLGLFPVGFAKTAFVSAADGKVVQVNETFFNRILEALSF